METLVIKTARATNPYVQPEMNVRSPSGQFHHEPPLLHNTAVTKQWNTKCPYIADAVFRIVKNHGE